MKKVTVTIETLTSLFSKGNEEFKNTKGKLERKSEFRITELKSLMRTTYREFFQFKDLQDMKKNEGKLFGDLDKKAPVSFKLIKPDNPDDIYSTNLKKVCHKDWKEHGIKKATKIEFEMFGRNEKILDMYFNLLIISSVFGSMGSRSRKGLGSFRIVAFSGDIDTNYTEWLEKEPLEILSLIKNHLTDNFKLREFKTSNEAITFTPYREKLLNFPYVKEIKLINFQEINDDFLTKISNLTHLRVEKKGYKKSKIIEPFKVGIENSWFIDNNILGNHNSGKSKVNRFTSPIWISFFGNETNKYLIVKVLNYDYFLLELYLLRKEYHLKNSDEFKKKSKNNKNQKNIMIDKMKLKETKNFEENKTSEVKKFKISNEDYINEYIKRIAQIGGGKWQSYSE